MKSRKNQKSCDQFVKVGGGELFNSSYVDYEKQLDEPVAAASNSALHFST